MRGFKSEDRDEARSVRLVDIAATMERETDKAWQISDGVTVAWVPKSQVERNGDGTFTMPEWLAKEKGFI